MTDQQEPSGFFRSITPTIWATLFVAVLSVFGALKVAVYNAQAQRTLEREQFESNLILKVIGTGNDTLNYENFRFLIEGGLIRPESDKVQKLLKNPKFKFHLPVDNSTQKAEVELPSSSAIRLYSYAMSAFSGIVIDEATAQPIKGVTVSIKTNRSRPRAEETAITGTDGQFVLHYPPRPFFLNFSLLGYLDQSIRQEASLPFKGPLIIRLKKSALHQYSN